MKRALPFLFCCIFSVAYAAKYTVLNNNVNGAGSLAQAITDANTSPGRDTIEFSIPGTGPFMIALAGGQLPLVTESVFINGSSQPGYTTLPLIEINGSAAQGLNLNANADGSEIHAIAVTGCAAQGIYLAATNVTIKYCHIGIRNGTTTVANLASGIHIEAGSEDHVIGYNVISGNQQHGILINNSDRNFIFANKIGLAADGNTARGNSQNGITLTTNCDYNRIGGTSSDSINIIGGNGQHGIEFNTNSRYNRVCGNYIGCAANGTSDVGNNAHGVLFTSGSHDNIVGGTGAQYRNVISGNNANGINSTMCNRLTIQSNFVGVSADGFAILGNTSNGVQLESSRDCIVGGDRATQGNVISNSGGAGFNDEGTVGGSKKLIFQGNLVGTDKDGFQNFGNGGIGVIIKSDSCTIGGQTPNLGNIISNTKQNWGLLCGLLMGNCSYGVIKYNMIGLYADSSAAGNLGDGINIGVENAGMFARNHLIEYNAIAYNGKNGISIGDALNTQNSTNEFNNTVQYNRIFCNTLKGIFLNLTVTNDRGNNGKAAPAINAALSNDSTLVGLASGLTAGDRVDVYKMTDCVSCDVNPQGKYYVGSTTVNGDGSWTYIPDEPFDGTLVATATDADGNTSEFSLCYTPCKATATINGAPDLIYLQDLSVQTVPLTADADFSELTPVPGKIYWMLNTTDTLQSLSNADEHTFSVSGNSSTELVSGLNTIYLIAKQSGCIDTARVTVRVLFIPNVITPNGDGKNDEWLLSNTSGLYEVSIFNRWGERVYQDADYTNGFGASGVSDGTYFYEIMEKEAGEKYKGWLQVLH